MTLTLNNKQIHLDDVSLDNLFSDLTDLQTLIDALLHGDRTQAEVQQVLARLNILADIYS